MSLRSFLYHFIIQIDINALIALILLSENATFFNNPDNFTIYT